MIFSHPHHKLYSRPFLVGFAWSLTLSLVPFELICLTLVDSHTMSDSIIDLITTNEEDARCLKLANFPDCLTQACEC